jgi:hypothetical protein
MRIQDLTTKIEKFSAEKYNFFILKIAVFCPQASMKDVQATGEAFPLAIHFCPPGSGSTNKNLQKSMRILADPILQQ